MTRKGSKKRKEARRRRELTAQHKEKGNKPDKKEDVDDQK